MVFGIGEHRNNVATLELGGYKHHGDCCVTELDMDHRHRRSGMGACYMRANYENSTRLDFTPYRVDTYGNPESSNAHKDSGCIKTTPHDGPCEYNEPSSNHGGDPIGHAIHQGDIREAYMRAGMEAPGPEKIGETANEEPMSFGTHYQEIRNSYDSLQRSMHLLEVEQKELYQERNRIDEKIAIRGEELERLARLRNHLQELKDSVEGVPVEAKLPDNVMPSFHNHSEYDSPVRNW